MWTLTRCYVDLPCNLLSIFPMENEIQHSLTDEASWLLRMSGREVLLIAAPMGPASVSRAGFPSPSF